VSEDTVEVFRVDNILLVYSTRLWKITKVWRSSPIIPRLSSIAVLYPKFPVTVGLARPSSMPGVLMQVALITNSVVYRPQHRAGLFISYVYLYVMEHGAFTT